MTSKTIEMGADGIISIKKCCLVCRYLQVNSLHGRTLIHGNHANFTCGADNPVQGQVLLTTICKLFELNIELDNYT